MKNDKEWDGELNYLSVFLVFISVSDFSLIGPFGLICFLESLEHKPSSVLKLISDFNVTFNIDDELYLPRRWQKDINYQTQSNDRW